MKNSKKISLGLLVLITLASCESLEAKYCSKSCKEHTSSTNIDKNESTKIVKTNEMKNDNLKFDFNSDEPLVCLLKGEERAEHKEALQKEIFSHVKKIEEIKDGYVFYFGYQEEFLMRMTDYVIAENNCCPFFTFETKLHSKEDISLKIVGPSRIAKEMIKTTLIEKE